MTVPDEPNGILDVELSTVERRAWYAVGLLTCAYIFSMLDRTILTLLIEPIQNDLGISDVQFGLLHGLTFAIFYLLAGLPLGWLADRGPRVAVVAAGVMMWSAATVASGFATRFGQLFVARIGVAVGEAALNPPTFSMLADMFPKQKLSRAVAVFSSGAMIGTALAFALGGGLIALLNEQPAVDMPVLGSTRLWQVAFLAAGAPGVVLALLILLTIKEPARRAGSTHVAAKDSVSELLPFLMRRRTVLLLHVSAFSCQNVMVFAFLTWFPALLLRVHEVPTALVGLIMAIASGGGGLLGYYIGGAAGDRWWQKGRRDAHLRVGLIACLLVLPLGIFAGLSGNLAATSIAIGLAIALIVSPAPPGIAALQMVTPPELRGRVSALFMMIASLIGLGLGPVVVAMLTDYVFVSKNGVGKSLAATTAIFGPLAIAAFAAGRHRVGNAIVEEVNAESNLFRTQMPG